ncbi:MAG TPA: phosphate ABC transporter permease subunit PstC [Candidatus Thiothrix moscowensis]|uniref:phosphate ABC transporter permease subunit PstC n=1 Tax=unclassified Thiothrix TaxID=2636184 RepID=UPI0025D4982B|nr:MULTISPECIES: phosphate ABC transporter permease subunit PstC [unclassified Thiothrix]HRJ53660.1 phosphate ABC transporter permease subunit PstC [Candidatus Thiothrix moscowensis]HRJ93742.1 phosphate ABC transporter permease subunit PstC [Candidatus Thiothrix moscowensis]
MSTLGILLTLTVLAAFSYYIGRKRSLALATPVKRGGNNLHSLPSYYGYLVMIWVLIPALLVFALWSALEKPLLTSTMISHLPAEIQNKSPDEISLTTNRVLSLAADDAARTSAEPVMQAAAEDYRQMQQTSSMIKTLLVLALAIAGGFIGWRYIKPETRARNQVERVVQFIMITCASIAILTTVGIVFSVLFESIRFFGHVNIFDFLFGTHWSPQTALRADQAGSSGAFGAIPLFVGTLLISFIALLIAVPLGLMSAIYLSEYASTTMRAYAKPAMEILAGIPTVVYGFFAALTVAPFIRDLGSMVGLSVASESALAAGIVMGVMIIPFMSSLSDDVINAVPQSMRDGSYGLGATKSETIKQVLLPAALPGIVGAFLLAASRAIGETMIVVMAAGLMANLTVNPLDAVTTITVQIVTLLKGDQEFDSAKTLAAFALGLSLFIVTLILNVVALHIVRKYREQYD